MSRMEHDSVCKHNAINRFKWENIIYTRIQRDIKEES